MLFRQDFYSTRILMIFGSKQKHGGRIESLIWFVLGRVMIRISTDISLRNRDYATIRMPPEMSNKTNRIVTLAHKGNTRKHCIKITVSFHMAVRIMAILAAFLIGKQKISISSWERRPFENVLFVFRGAFMVFWELKLCTEHDIINRRKVCFRSKCISYSPRASAWG